jgi:pimeloyl-ACP methyl ester carboxylesterase
VGAALSALVCLHSSASTGRQWRALAERLAGRFRVIAPDLHGCGKSAAWPAGRPMSLADEVDLLEPVFHAAGERFHLLGHSYGGAVALKAALEHPGRFISLVLYEPSLFSVLVADAPQSEAAREIVALRDETTRLVEAGDLSAAAHRFLDYWIEPGAWAALPQARRDSLAASMPSVMPQWQAAFGEPAPLRAAASIAAPTLILTGTASKASSRAVVRLVASVIPNARTQALADVGHMAPVTHPDLVNPAIEEFLQPR